MARTGRPKLSEAKGIDFSKKKQYEELIKYVELSLTLAEVAYIMGISKDTLRREIKAQLGVSFATLQKNHQAMLKARARRNLIKLSDAGSESCTIYFNKITGALEEKDKQMINLRKQEIAIKKQQVDQEANTPNVTLDIGEYIAGLTDADKS